ncbi:MAG TPA: hypothetical protein DCG58_05585 [Hyphomonas adhaerens]|uniref:HTH cro/C1-type domain-containing protein n=2 Tax=Hyphomonadaceae TaxID=69657 RepID=A0A3B9GW25_9PROT|nr:hypothetical protein [Hyphomonas sp.]HAE26612.1 hypothetical protein [Hyphomonas adhaerens]|tara:strand:- start:522 stop:989 length:468 start_codon:yes stop_codon:yes gene_type:complete
MIPTIRHLSLFERAGGGITQEEGEGGMNKKRKQVSGFRSRAPTEVDKRVGCNIRALRQAGDMTLSELAEALGISHQQLQKYETGTNRISASMIVDLINVLNVDIEDLFQGVRSEVAKDSPLEKARRACRVWINRADSAEKLKQMARVLKALSGKE